MEAEVLLDLVEEIKRQPRSSQSAAHGDHTVHSRKVRAELASRSFSHASRGCPRPFSYSMTAREFVASTATHVGYVIERLPAG